MVRLGLRPATTMCVCLRVGGGVGTARACDAISAYLGILYTLYTTPTNFIYTGHISVCGIVYVTFRDSCQIALCV